MLTLRDDPVVKSDERDPIVRASISAQRSNYDIFTQNPSQKLQVILEISLYLSQTLDQEVLLHRLLESLLRLFPQADRGMVLLCEGGRYLVRAQRSRQGGANVDHAFSRTIVRRALDEGVALLSEDVRADPNLNMTATVVSLQLRSFMCVPLLGREGGKLGVIQLDSTRTSETFRNDDLEMLTAVALQVAVVLENVTLHQIQLREARMAQELTTAREVQQQFLPREFGALQPRGTELFAQVLPARSVSGDLYDFVPLPDGRLALLLGDVSGKGMPAALFMIAVRTLFRHLAPSSKTPAELLQQLHVALAADNPTNKFVTLLHGIFDPGDNSVRLVSGGHLPPLLRRADGSVSLVEVQPGPVIGFSLLPVCDIGELTPKETRIVLGPNETLMLYTDGFTEAFDPERKNMFGVERLSDAFGGPRTQLPLDQCAREISSTIKRFTREEELQDDQTLLFLRRK